MGGMEQNPDSMGHLQPDPLLKPGAFIDPNPPASNGKPVSNQKSGSDPPPIERPEWLPSGWTVEEKVRASGVTAGSKDKYYVCPNTNRRFRSKKEVFAYLGDGSVPSKKRKTHSDADTTPQPSSQSSKKKKKKTEVTVEDLVKRFNFIDAPTKVKWELADAYEGSFRPLINSTDKVPESTKNEWAITFRYLTLQSSGSMLL